MIQNPGFLSDHPQNLITGRLCHARHILKVSERCVHNFLSYLVHTQTDRQTNKVRQNITSLAEVKTLTTLINVTVGHRQKRVYQRSGTNMYILAEKFHVTAEIHAYCNKHKKPSSITSDINVHFHAEGDTHRTKLNDILTAFDFVQRVSTPTQYHDPGGLLDVVITSCISADVLTDVTVTKIGRFDHSLVSWSVSTAPLELTYRTITSRRWRNFDAEGFMSALSNSDFCRRACVDKSITRCLGGQVGRPGQYGILKGFCWIIFPDTVICWLSMSVYTTPSIFYKTDILVCPTLQAHRRKWAIRKHLKDPIMPRHLGVKWDACIPVLPHVHRTKTKSEINLS